MLSMSSITTEQTMGVLLCRLAAHIPGDSENLLAGCLLGMLCLCKFRNRMTSWVWKGLSNEDTRASVRLHQIFNREIIQNQLF